MEDKKECLSELRPVPYIGHLRKSGTHGRREDPCEKTQGWTLGEKEGCFHPLDTFSHADVYIFSTLGRGGGMRK